jgi:hypothetical protein
MEFRVVATGRVLAVALICLLPQQAQALMEPSRFHGEPWRPSAAEQPVARICHLIESAAQGHNLPPEFFARLIWKESRFDIKAISYKGAQGIAQFMPTTAKMRGLADPFDPSQAIPASAALLSDLKVQFGNFGLAAAAYNAGEHRVAAWLGGQRGLPGETLAYVHSITFRPAKWFREPGREVEPRPLDEALPFDAACRRLPVMKTRAVFYAGAEWQPWGVQVAGNRYQSAAMRQFARMQRRFPAILGDAEPMIASKRAGLGRKRIWTVQVGAPSRRAALRLCARLRASGAACMVRRN